MVSLTTDNVKCHVHQINGGDEEATVVGNSATVLFEGTGPSAGNVVTDFRILVDLLIPATGMFETQHEFPCSNTGAASPFTATCAVEAGKAIDLEYVLWGFQINLH